MGCGSAVGSLGWVAGVVTLIEKRWPAIALRDGSRTATPSIPSTSPLDINALTRSRDRLGSASVSARPSRQPSVAPAIPAPVMETPPSLPQKAGTEGTQFKHVVAPPHRRTHRVDGGRTGAQGRGEGH